MMNEKLVKKTLILSIFISAIAAFFFYDLNQLANLSALKDQLQLLTSLRDSNPVVVGGAFLLLYVAITALSLPGAALLTLAAGALFGLLWGTLIASFASTIGATVAFLISRFILQDSIQTRFSERLKAIDQGMKKDGALYLFTLRLVPVFPFFLINLLMGLTSIKVTTFYWVSQVGMFAGTLVYVNAGTQLGQLNSLSGILSPTLLLSFVVLGFFPLIAKKIVSIVQSRKIYAGFKKPKSFDRNLIVIGAGAGGLVTSYIAAAVNAKVTLIESNKMGGDCLNYGCVPSKALIKSAKLAQQIRDAGNYGLESSEPQFSFRKIMARVHDVISKVEPHDSVERYTSLGVEVLQGYAKMVDPWTVEVQLNDGRTQRLTSRHIVLATGAEPVIPSIPGIDKVNCLTSDTLWEDFAKHEDIPARIVVLGGGPIGCELAQCFARLGSKVHQLEKNTRVMKREDVDVSAWVKTTLEQAGVSVLVNHNVLRFEIDGNRKILVAEHNGKEVTLAFDALLCAVGRAPLLNGYGLEALGITTDKTILANEYLETNYPNILAVGDVVGPYQFTHIAAHQAWYAAVNSLFGGFKKFKVDYRIVPQVTFIDPEIARVGLNEQEAKQSNTPYELTRYELDDLDRAITESAAYGFIKVLTKPGKDKILGVTIVGEHAGDLLAEFVLAMKHNLGLSKILGTIHAYPTWAEANKYAAGEWKRAHAPQTILRWLEKFHSWRRQ